MPTNILNREFPAKSIAFISGVEGKAVIEDTDGKVYTYDVNRPEGEPLQEEQLGFHPGFWMQPAMSPIGVESRYAGAYPFTEFREYVENRYRIHSAIRHFMLSIDSEMSVEMREASAKFATALLEDDAVFVELGPILASTPLIPGSDPTHGPKEGNAGAILKLMIDLAK